jgi:hypothetical protein
MSDDSTKQEFLTELEEILESDEAYGSNIQILTYAIEDKAVSGKFKDSWNNRVYEFVIDEDEVSYKPAGKFDSTNTDDLPVRFDAFSEGYNSLFGGVRLDRNPIGKRVKKPKCGGSAYGCGFSCIGLQKTCRILSSDKKARTNQGKAIGKERLIKLANLARKLNNEGETKKAKIVYLQAKNIKEARDKHRLKGNERKAERIAERITQQKTGQQSNSIKSSETLVVNPEIFKTKFPSKEVQREFSLGGVIDRAQTIIDIVNNPKLFTKTSPNDQAGFLDNIVTTHGVSDKDWNERLQVPAVVNNEERRLGAIAANIRAQGAKQIWDNLSLDEKTKLAKSLKEIGSGLANENDKFENKYVAQISDEVRKINNPSDTNNSQTLSNKEFKTIGNAETREKLKKQWKEMNAELNELSERRGTKGIDKKRIRAATEIIGSLFDMSEYEDYNFNGIVDSKGNLQAAYISHETEKGYYVDYLASAPWNSLESHPKKKIGAGASAMEAIVKTAIAKDKGQIELESTRNAVPFYEKVGFKKQKGGAQDYPIMTLEKESAKQFLMNQKEKNRQDTKLLTQNSDLTELEQLEEEALGLFTIPQDIHKKVIKKIESDQG